MPNPTKSPSARQFATIPLDVARQIDRLAVRERRSFTRMVQTLVAEALTARGVREEVDAPDRAPLPAGASGQPSTPCRDVRLDSLTEPPIPPGCLRQLAHAGPVSIQTVGELADYVTTNGDLWASDFHQIGEGAVAKIAAALKAFWRRRGGQEQAPEAEVAGDVGGEAEAEAVVDEAGDVGGDFGVAAVGDIGDSDYEGLQADGGEASDDSR